MKPTIYDYINLSLFILSSALSTVLFALSLLYQDNASIQAVFAIIFSVFAMVKSPSLTNIILNHLYQKAVKSPGTRFDGVLSKLESYKVDIGQFFAGTVLVPLLFTIPSIFTKNWLLTTGFVVIGSLSLVLVLINTKYFKDYLYSHFTVTQVSTPQNSP